MLSTLNRTNKWLLFFAFLALWYLLGFMFTELLPVKQIVYNSIGEQLGREQFELLFKQSEEWAWMGYVQQPIIILLRMSFVAMCLMIGSLFFELKLSFKKAFHFALIGEIAFLAATAVKLAVFLIIGEPTLEFLSVFSPLSLMNFFDVHSIDGWLVYPLQTFNLFEVAFWCILARLLAMEFQKPFWYMFRFVVSTYGVGLLIWIVFVVFMSLNA